MAQRGGVTVADEKQLHNYIVISDLHFGEELGESGDAMLHFQRLTRAFSRFLEYYDQNRQDGLPWRLIIAGDMIDFIRARIIVDEHAEPARDACTQAALALDRIITEHPARFLDLARFMAAGNEVVILKGNHDVDLHWEEIQTRLVDHLAALLPEHADAVRARVQFSRWFWHEPDVVYVEHGNQYDRFCSFEHVLEPTIQARELEEPIAHQILRAFGGLIAGTIDLHAADRLSLFDFLRWLVRLGPGLIGRLACTYFASIAWMIDTRRRLSRAASHAREGQRSRVAELADRFTLGEEVIHSLDALRERPAGWRIRDGFRLLFMDRVFFFALAALAGIGFLFRPLPSIDKIFGLAILGACVAATTIALARLREVSPVRKLRQVARRIQEMVRVPYVVFGHSHVPEDEPLENGGKYFNTGSWSGDAGGGLTHLCIMRDQEMRAELRRWCTQAESPIPATTSSAL